MNIRAIIEGDFTSKLKDLLDSGWNPSHSQNDTALKLAISYGRREMVKMLISIERKGVKFYGHNILRWVNLNGHDGILYLFLSDKRLDPSYDDNFALIVAVENGYNDTVKMLISDHRVRNKITEEMINEYPLLKTLMRRYKIEALNL